MIFEKKIVGSIHTDFYQKYTFDPGVYASSKLVLLDHSLGVVYASSD
jgi:hypothetical protein